jgi:hypothetical protein
MDTVFLKKGQVFITSNKAYPINIDTVIIIPSNIKYEISPSRADNFFDRLSKGAEKRRWTRELHNIILHPYSNNKENDSLKTRGSTEPYIPYSGWYIRNIKIRQLDVFGPTIDDTSRIAKTWLERRGNMLHVQSKQYLIKNNLLFSANGAIDPVKLADNERILRALPYIEDARIIVMPVCEATDSADILVIVKDVWAKAFNIKVNDVNSGSFEMWDKNLFGFGHEIQNDILWNTQEHPSTGYSGQYTIPNISGSFISCELSYYNSFHKESFGVDLERKFFTPNIKYAGGISAVHTQTHILFKTDTISYIPLGYNNYDFWAGRSFPLRSTMMSKVRHNFTITARISRDDYLDRPNITRKSYYNYQNKTLLLSSLSYTVHSYFKSNFIYNFGRTEDIPIGSGIEVTLGREFNEFANRSYAACKLSIGQFLCDWGYLYYTFRTGSFFAKKWDREQAVINTKLNYFSPLCVIKKYRFRQFFNIEYTAGYNRFQNEYLLISEDAGITGLFNDSTRGNKRLNVHWETDCFTPWGFYDFHFVLFLFADHSWLVKSGCIFNSRPYTGIGLGLRIRNERLVFNTIQFRFAIYPVIPPDSRVDNFRISGETVLNQQDFLTQAPEIVSFQ